MGIPNRSLTQDLSRSGQMVFKPLRERKTRGEPYLIEINCLRHNHERKFVREIAGSFLNVQLLHHQLV